MNPLKKEFLELFEKSGWSQADLARELGITRGGVHGLVKGDTNPSEATMRLFRLALWSQGSGMGNPGMISDSAPSPIITQDARNFLAELESVPREKRAELLDAFHRIVRIIKLS